MRISRRVVFVISGLLIFLALFFAYLKYLFWEPYDVERESLVYQLKIPGFAKKYPIWNASDTPIYDLSNPDGLAPGMVRITYISNSDLKGLLSELRRLKYTCNNSAYEYVHCDKIVDDDLSYYVKLKEVNDGTDVRVEIIGGYQ